MYLYYMFIIYIYWDVGAKTFLKCIYGSNLLFDVCASELRVRFLDEWFDWLPIYIINQSTWLFFIIWYTSVLFCISSKLKALHCWNIFWSINDEIDFRGRHSFIRNQHHRRSHGFSSVLTIEKQFSWTFLDRHPRPWCPLSCGQCWSLQLAGWNVCEISLPERYSDFDLGMNGLNNRHNWGVWRPGGFDLHQSVGCPVMGRFEPPSILGTSSLSTPISGSTLPRFWV